MQPGSWLGRARQMVDRWVLDYFLDVIALLLFVIIGLVFFLDCGLR